MTERKRKPVIKPKPLPEATDAVVWRARILCEFLEGIDLNLQIQDAFHRLERAIKDYEHAKSPIPEKELP